MICYRYGMERVREARAEEDAKYPGPAIGPDRGGISLEKFNEPIKDWLEIIVHKHDPHIEEERAGEVMPGPGVR